MDIHVLFGDLRDIAKCGDVVVRQNGVNQPAIRVPVVFFRLSTTRVPQNEIQRHQAIVAWAASHSAVPSFSRVVRSDYLTLA
ncbi:MAG: hypothetical protein EBY17_19585 [Acidobacteriia bacterium]|nr:hypothetical protein [Terriglobia bacterium]